MHHKSGGSDVFGDQPRDGAHAHDPFPRRNPGDALLLARAGLRMVRHPRISGGTKCQYSPVWTTASSTVLLLPSPLPLTRPKLARANLNPKP